MTTSAQIAVPVSLLERQFGSDIAFPHRDSALARTSLSMVIETPRGAGSSAASFPRLVTGANHIAAERFIIRVVGTLLRGCVDLRIVAQRARLLCNVSVPADGAFTLDMVVHDLAECTALVVVNAADEAAAIQIDTINVYAVLGMCEPNPDRHPAPANALLTTAALL